ncbi:PDF receptor-like [Glandiceps talaboti]
MVREFIAKDKVPLLLLSRHRKVCILPVDKERTALHLKWSIPCFVLLCVGRPHQSTRQRRRIARLQNGGKKEIKQHIVENTKILQIVGYSISLASLIISLVIFYSFRSLHCPRTKIHKQLFISYIVWIVLDIVFWVDLTKDVDGLKQVCGKQGGTIRNTPILCETSVFLMEYTRFCVFTWNFVEGLYLHRLITAAVFRKPNYTFYFIIGWVVALFPVTGWAVAMHYTNDEQCWLGYVFSPYYWIIEGPRNILLFVNLIFLINIVRVLITKMRESNTADTMQVKKAVKAAMVLVPLLGVINLLFIPDRPDATAQPWVLYLYFYATSILVTFQGLVCALIFCFCNGEFKINDITLAHVFLLPRIIV